MLNNNCYYLVLYQLLLFWSLSRRFSCLGALNISRTGQLDRQNWPCSGMRTRDLFLKSPETFRAYLYLRNSEVLNHHTSQSSWFFLHLKHVQRSAFQNKWIAVWQLAFWARKVLRTFEKQAQALISAESIIIMMMMVMARLNLLFNQGNINHWWLSGLHNKYKLSSLRHVISVMGYMRLRIPTGRRQTSWLCTRAVKELNRRLH